MVVNKYEVPKYSNKSKYEPVKSIIFVLKFDTGLGTSVTCFLVHFEKILRYYVPYIVRYVSKSTINKNCILGVRVTKLRPGSLKRI